MVAASLQLPGALNCGGSACFPAAHPNQPAVEVIAPRKKKKKKGGKVRKMIQLKEKENAEDQKTSGS